MNKYQQLAEALFKAGVGEGSHGGHVIGHTKTGKPIYASSSHPEHSGFTPQEHHEAMNHHYEIWSKTNEKIANLKQKRPHWNPPKPITDFLHHHHTQMQMHQNRASRGLARQDAAKKVKSTVQSAAGAKPPYFTPTNIHKGLNDIEIPFLAAVVIISPDRKKVLLGKRADGKGWESPAGHADIGERPEDVAIREAFEEFNVPLKESQLEHLPMMYKKDMTPVHCFMAVTSPDQIKNVSIEDDPSEEHKKWKWFELNGQLPDAMEDNRYNTLIHAKMHLAGILEMTKSYEMLDQTEGMTQIHTTEFAEESKHGANVQRLIEEKMKDYHPGDIPIMIALDGISNLHLVRVDDGIFSGFVKKVDSEGLEETVANVDKMTIPTLVQFLRAKQLLSIEEPEADKEKHLKLVLEALMTPKVEQAAMIYVSMDGDNIGNKVAQAEADNDEQRLMEMSHKINAGQSVFNTWTQSVGGSIIEAGGDEGLAKVPASALDKVENFRAQYMSVSGATVTVGVGKTISDSTRARQLGKLKGKNRVEIYGASSEEELKQLLKPLTEAEKILESGVIKLQKALESLDESALETFTIKTLSETEDFAKGKSLPVGSVRVWNGQHFRKEATGHWVPLAGAGGPSPDATAAPSKLVTPEGEPAPTKEVKPQANHLKHLLPKEGMGGHVTAHSRDVKNALGRGPISIISAGRNPSVAADRGLTDQQISAREKKLEQDLQDMGLKYMKVKGKYNGGSEDSFLVFHADPEKMNELGKKYNQESVIHSTEGKNRLHFATGENEGKHHKGEGHTAVPDDAKDNYSELTTADGKKMRFNLNLDFGKLHGKQ